MRHLVYCFIVLIFNLVFFPVNSYATQPPNSLAGGTIIDSYDVKRLQKIGGIRIFDQRNAINYGRGHLPKAEFLPCKNMPNCISLSQLPSNKKNKIIFYSQGITDSKSYQAAKTAIEAGYQNVYWFRGGYTDWVMNGNHTER